MDSSPLLASPSLPSRFYDFVLDLGGHDEFTVAVVGTSVVGMLYYALFNVFFVFLDFVDPAWVQPYRVQEGDNKKVSFARWLRAFKLISFNLVVVGPICAYLAYKLSGFDMSRELPSLPVALAHIAVFTICEEIGFYYTHRLFHHPRIYKYVHKIHHEWTAPVSITSIYAHPIEHALSNLMPILSGPVLLHSHILVAWAWFGLAVWSTTCSHSGYHLPLMSSPEAHDYHHVAFTECFGVLGILDRLHNTNKTFRRLANYKRHYTTFTVEPVKQIHPKEKQ